MYLGSCEKGTTLQRCTYYTTRTTASEIHSVIETYTTLKNTQIYITVL